MCVSASDCGRKPEEVEELIYLVAAKETRTQLSFHRANTSNRSQVNIFENVEKTSNREPEWKI